jgi:Leucine-rich repeat (LRR) protein
MFAILLWKKLGNNFGRLEMSDFESVPQVRLLVLDDSNITSIADDTFGRLEQLERLSLNGNSLTNVPSNLPSAGWLTALYLDGNRISTLHSSDFDGQQRLDQLHLARNVIDSIAMGAFHSLTRLVVNILLLFLHFLPPPQPSSPSVRSCSTQFTLASAESKCRK